MEARTLLKKREQELERNIAHLAKVESEYHTLRSTVPQLSAELRPSVMVPVGKRAFMPGHLVHTSEYTVLLGDGWFAEYSATHALEVVERRLAHIAQEKEALNAQLAQLKQNVAMAAELLDEANDGTVKLWERYEDDKLIETSLPMHPEPAPAAAPADRSTDGKGASAAQFAELRRRLDALVALEEAGELQEDDDSDVIPRPVVERGPSAQPVTLASQSVKSTVVERTQPAQAKAVQPVKSTVVERTHSVASTVVERPKPVASAVVERVVERAPAAQPTAQPTAAKVVERAAQPAAQPAARATNSTAQSTAQPAARATKSTAQPTPSTAVERGPGKAVTKAAASAATAPKATSASPAAATSSTGKRVSIGGEIGREKSKPAAASATPKKSAMKKSKASEQTPPKPVPIVQATVVERPPTGQAPSLELITPPTMLDLNYMDNDDEEEEEEEEDDDDDAAGGGTDNNLYMDEIEAAYMAARTRRPDLPPVEDQEPPAEPPMIEPPAVQSTEGKRVSLFKASRAAAADNASK